MFEMVGKPGSKCGCNAVFLVAGQGDTALFLVVVNGVPALVTLR